MSIFHNWYLMIGRETVPDKRRAEGWEFVKRGLGHHKGAELQTVLDGRKPLEDLDPEIIRDMYDLWVIFLRISHKDAS
jgi:hypothetical protein